MKRPKKIRGIIESAGYVFIRKKVNGKLFKKSYGRADNPEVWATAKNALHEINEQVRLGKFKLEDKTQRVLIPAAIELFTKKHGPTWIYQLRAFSEFFSTTYLDDLTYLKLEEYAAKRAAAGVNPATINREFTGMSSLCSHFRLWIKLREIKPVALPDAELFKLYREKVGWYDERLNRRKIVLTDSECSLWIQVATPRVKRATEAALNTVLRRKDLFALSKNNSALANHTLEGKQHKVGSLYVVPSNDNIARLFEEADGNLLDDTNFRAEFEASRERFIAAGGRHFQWKDLRRTSLWRIWEATKDILLCRDVAGHKDVKTTQLYLGLSERDIQKAGEILAKHFTFTTVVPERKVV